MFDDARAELHAPKQEIALLANALNLLVPMSTDDGEFHGPSILEFFPDPIAFEGTPFEINRIILVRWVAVIALLLVFWLGTRRMKVVPGRFQSLVEMGLDLVRVNIADDLLGKKDGRRFLPILTTIFFLVLFMNLTGVIPFLNIAGTSVIGLPIIFALWVYFLYLWQGVKKFGVGGYLKHSLFPPGVPKPIYLLLTPVEFLQVFILRPATLVIRLLANMMAGHLLLALCFAATSFLFFEASGAVKAFGAVTFVAGFAFFLLEVFVAALQAYVFSILTAVYLQMSISEEH